MIHQASPEQLEVEAAQERIELEAHLELRARELETERAIAKLKYSVNLRQRALIRFVKLPTHLFCIFSITLLALFKRPIPPTLSAFLEL